MNQDQGAGNYTYNLTNPTDKDKIRLMIPDRPDHNLSGPKAAFTDEELQTFLAIEGDIMSAAAAACEALAGDKAKQAVSVSLSSGLSIGKTSISQQLLARAEKLRKRANVLGLDAAGGLVEYIDGVAYDVDDFGNDNSEYI